MCCSSRHQPVALHETRFAYKCVAVCCSVLQCAAVRCSVLQFVAVCCSMLQQVAVRDINPLPYARYDSLTCVLQCVAVCCNVLQCVAVCCSVLQCVAVCHSRLQSETSTRCPTRDSTRLHVCCSVLLCVAVAHVNPLPCTRHDSLTCVLQCVAVC